MQKNRLGLVLLCLAAATLGTVALRAHERTYAVPERAPAAPIPLALTGDVPAGFVVRNFAVEGICCQGCSGKLRGALMALEGVREVAVDPLSKQVSALVREDMTSTRLEQALTFDKYSARAR